MYITSVTSVQNDMNMKNVQLESTKEVTLWCESVFLGGFLFQSALLE